MPNFTSGEMEDLIVKVLDAATAPPGSALYAETPLRARVLIERGDTGDAWVFVSALVYSIVKCLGLDSLECTCGDPDHRPEVSFGFAPEGKDGKPELENAFFGNLGNAPDYVSDLHPELLAFSKMVEAEVNHDVDESQKIWKEALDNGYWGRLINVSMKQAGDIRRTALAQGGNN